MKKFAFLLLLVTSFIYAQEPKKEIYFIDIIESAISGGHFDYGEHYQDEGFNDYVLFDKKITIDEHYSSMKYKSLKQEIEKRVDLNILNYKNKKLVIPSLHFFNCEFIMDEILSLELDSLYIMGLNLNNSKGLKLQIINSHVEDFTVQELTSEGLRFINCTFTGVTPNIRLSNIEWFSVVDSKFFPNNVVKPA